MPRHRRSPTPPSAGRGRVAVACAVVAMLGVGTLLWTAARPDDPAVGSSPYAQGEALTARGEVSTARGEVLTARGEVSTARGEGVVDWVGVLERLDDARAAAFASGRPQALRRVYAPGSAVLRKDQRLLVAYAERGLAVTGLETSISDLRVLEHDDTAAVLLVVDQVSGAVRDADGDTRPLPDDRRSSHRIELVRDASAVDAGWRIASISGLR